MAQDAHHSESLDVSGIWSVPKFTDVMDVSEPADAEKSYVVSNAATGRYFMANAATVALLNGLRDTGHVAMACARAGIEADAAGPILKRFIDFGLIVRAGETHATEILPKAPAESRFIMMRWDLLDVQRIVARLAWIGRFAYSWVGLLVWTCAVAAMLFQLLNNPEKLRLTMMRVLDAGPLEWLLFAGIIVVLKLVHELGHAFAYREMMLQEGLEPGPIRTGICIFAFTPFPFTDVSAAWQLRDRSRRVIIGAGGIYFETWAMAALTLIWAQTGTGVFQTVALQVAVVSGALALLFNLNPAVKLDGYFMLTDWLRKPNLAAKASLAARGWVARRLGARVPKAGRGELAYWCVSYAYRWTIFAGIFWLVYQFDPRLGPVIGAIIVMMLIVRPILSTVAFIRSRDAKLWRSLGLASLLALAAVALLVPLPGRVLVDAHVVRFDTRFVTVTEAGWLRSIEGKVTLENPDLALRITDLEIQRDVLSLLGRAQFTSAAEQARVVRDLEANTDALTQLQARVARLDLSGDGGIWTDLGADTFRNMWITPRADPIGAVSQAIPMRVDILVDQRRLSDPKALSELSFVALRALRNPNCIFIARPRVSNEQFVAVQNTVRLTADPVEPDQSCAQSLHHGAALVAKIPLPPSSLVARVWLLASRALQDRLDVSIQS